MNSRLFARLCAITVEGSMSAPASTPIATIPDFLKVSFMNSPCAIGEKVSALCPKGD